MNRRTILSLIELVLMLLVLAVAAAFALQTFFRADQISKENAARDQALLQLQSAAEVLKTTHGDFSAAAAIHGGTAGADQWQLSFDDGWKQTTDGCYRLQITRLELDIPHLGGARLEILQPGGSVLAGLEVRWQEVAP